MRKINLATISVMVVEDCEYVRHMLVDMLGSFGISLVHDVGSARDAIRRFRYATPDLLIADWLMSPVTGIELANFVRRDTASPNPYMPIIMATMNTAPECVFAARDAGVNEILAKPFAPTTLHQRIHQVLSAPRPFVRAPAYFGPDRRRHAATFGEQRMERRTEGAYAYMVPVTGPQRAAS